MSTPLDSITSVCAYSTRKLRTAYAGNCLQVTRNSDNAPQDIGFVSGWVDYASITAFAPGGYRVNTWYDQSGNVRNMLIAGGATLVVNNTGIHSNPSIAFDGVSYFANSSISQAANYTAIAVVQASSPTGFILNGDDVGTGGTSRIAQYMRYLTAPGRLTSISFNNPLGSTFQVDNNTTVTNAHVVSVISDGSNVTNWVDGTSNSTAESGTMAGGISSLLTIGAFWDGSTALTGQIGEVILLGTASPTNRLTLQTDELLVWLGIGGGAVPTRTTMGVGISARIKRPPKPKLWGI
jgi:hypothetical protein